MGLVEEMPKNRVTLEVKYFLLLQLFNISNK